jgi:simple sugar transport system permease protein
MRLLRFLLLPFAALVITALVVRAAGQDPIMAAHALIRGSVGTPRNLMESLAKTIPLIMTGLSVALAFRAGFFNIGAEGQFIMGTLAAAALGAKAQLPWPFALLGGAVAGGLWAALAGWMKVRRITLRFA